jgi:hypothetical protein
MDYVKTLAEIKKYLLELVENLEDQISNQKNQLTQLRALNNMIDKSLGQTSFKTASQVAEENPVKNYLINDKEDRSIVYAEVTVTGNEMVVVPSLDREYSIDHSAFQQFLIGKVLEPQQEEEIKKVETKELSPEDQFSYTIEVNDKRVLTKLSIHNVKSVDIQKRIYGALRWTFSKIASKK